MKSLYKTLGIVGISLAITVAAPVITLAQEARPTASTPTVADRDFVMLAANAIAVEDYQNAIHHANQAIDLNPNQAEAYFLRGQARLKLGDREAAIADLKQAASQFLQDNNVVGYRSTINLLSDV